MTAFNTAVAGDTTEYKRDQHGNYVVGQWSVQVVTDDVTGKKSCAVAQYVEGKSILLLPQISQAPVGFFDNPSSADYSFDGGAVATYDMSTYGGEGLARGAAAQKMILIPLGEFANHRKLEVKGSGDAVSKVFDLTGFSDLPKAEATFGCVQ